MQEIHHHGLVGREQHGGPRVRSDVQKDLSNASNNESSENEPDIGNHNAAQESHDKDGNTDEKRPFDPQSLQQVPNHEGKKGVTQTRRKDEKALVVVAQVIVLLDERQVHALGRVRSAKGEKHAVARNAAEELFQGVAVKGSLFLLLHSKRLQNE